MLTVHSLCGEIATILHKIPISHPEIFKYINSFFYLCNNNIIRIDYCKYYGPKIKKRLAKIKNSNNSIEKLIKLNNLCKKIYEFSLSKLGNILEINNVPVYRKDGSKVMIDDFWETFSVMGQVNFILKVADNSYIVSFKNKLNNLLLNELLQNKIMETNLIQTRLITAA